MNYLFLNFLSVIYLYVNNKITKKLQKYNKIYKTVCVYLIYSNLKTIKVQFVINIS